MRLHLTVLVDDDLDPDELELLKRDIIDFVEDQDSGAVRQADWVEVREVKK